MDAVDVARWQFAITTVYHFLFVPITIGLSLSSRCFHTAVAAHRQPRVPAADQVLRQALHSSTSPSAWSPASCRSSSSG